MTDTNNRDQQVVEMMDLSGHSDNADEMVHINKQEIPIGSMGENLLAGVPLYSGLKKLEVVLPENSAAGTESSIFKRFMTNKAAGHGFAYEDLEKYGYSLEEQATSIATGEGVEEYIGVTKEAATLDMPEADGSIGHYTPVTIKTKNAGIIAQMLYSPETHEIKVLFRGTSDIETAAADAELDGPGAESFAEDANTILAQVNEMAGKIGATKVSVSGHSLGGALSQLFVSSFIEAKAQNHGLRRSGQTPFPDNIRNHLATITELQADVFNPAGVSQKICAQVKESLSYLKSRQPNFKMSMNYCLVGGDLVQQLYNKILSDVEPSLALVTLLKLQNGYEGWGLPSSLAAAGAGAAVGMAVAGPVGSAIGGVLGAAGGAIPAAKNTHCDAFYLAQGSENRNVGYIIATNETDEGRALLQRELNHKTSLTDTTVSNAVQGAVVKAARAINRVVIQPLKKAAKAVVENVVNPIKNAVSRYIVNPISRWWNRKPTETKPVTPVASVTTKIQSNAISTTAAVATTAATLGQKQTMHQANTVNRQASTDRMSKPASSFVSTNSPHARAQARVAASKQAASASKPAVVTTQTVCFQKQREEQTKKIANLDLVRTLQQRFYVAISPIEKSILSICSDAKMTALLNAKQLEELSLIGKKINAFPYKMLNKELNIKEGVAEVVGILKDLTRYFNDSPLLTTTLGPSIQESMKSLGYFLHSAFHEVSKENIPADMKAGIKRGLDFMNTHYLELDTHIRKAVEESYVAKVLMKNVQEVSAGG